MNVHHSVILTPSCVLFYSTAKTGILGALRRHASPSWAIRSSVSSSIAFDPTSWRRRCLFPIAAYGRIQSRICARNVCAEIDQILGTIQHGKRFANTPGRGLLIAAGDSCGKTAH